jgi:hypothetical protein
MKTEGLDLIAAMLIIVALSKGSKDPEKSENKISLRNSTKLARNWLGILYTTLLKKKNSGGHHVVTS